MAVNDLVDREERPAYVKFETVAIEDKQASLKAGHSVSKDIDYALITPPYSKDCVRMRIDRWRDTNKYEAKMGRLPAEWLKQWEKMYQDWRNGQETPLNGTAIKEWSAISPAQIKNLIGIGIYTVEDLANANAQGMSRIGMGANDLKRKAVNWLASAENTGKVTLRISQLEADKERDDLTIQSLTEKVEKLSQQLEIMAKGNIANNNMQYDDVPRGTISATDILDEPEQNANLKEAYFNKFGKKADGRMTDASIRRKLEE